jgi:hypothetical protein
VTPSSQLPPLNPCRPDSSRARDCPSHRAERSQCVSRCVLSVWVSRDRRRRSIGASFWLHVEPWRERHRLYGVHGTLDAASVATHQERGARRTTPVVPRGTCVGPSPNSRGASAAVNDRSAETVQRCDLAVAASDGSVCCSSARGLAPRGTSNDTLAPPGYSLTRSGWLDSRRLRSSPSRVVASYDDLAETHSPLLACTLTAGRLCVGVPGPFPEEPIWPKFTRRMRGSSASPAWRHHGRTKLLTGGSPSAAALLKAG